MLQVPASSPLHAAVMFGSLTKTRSGDRTGKWDVKHLLIFGLLWREVTLKYSVEIEREKELFPQMLNAYLMYLNSKHKILFVKAEQHKNIVPLTAGRCFMKKG